MRVLRSKRGHFSAFFVVEAAPFLALASHTDSMFLWGPLGAGLLRNKAAIVAFVLFATFASTRVSFCDCGRRICECVHIRASVVGKNRTIVILEGSDVVPSFEIYIRERGSPVTVYRRFQFSLTAAVVARRSGICRRAINF